MLCFQTFSTKFVNCICQISFNEKFQRMKKCYKLSSEWSYSRKRLCATFIRFQGNWKFNLSRQFLQFRTDFLVITQGSAVITQKNHNRVNTCLIRATASSNLKYNFSNNCIQGCTAKVTFLPNLSAMMEVILNISMSKYSSKKVLMNIIK